MYTHLPQRERFSPLLILPQSITRPAVPTSRFTRCHSGQHLHPTLQPTPAQPVQRLSRCLHRQPPERQQAGSKSLPTSLRFCPLHFFRLAFLPSAFQNVPCLHGKNRVFSAFLYPQFDVTRIVQTREGREEALPNGDTPVFWGRLMAGVPNQAAPLAKCSARALFALLSLRTCGFCTG